ncbi:hypothetical protein vBKpMFBKp34_246 [Klebsiella phage vB_KpM_FBKp34]|nr:hypothetical protein vBKpMFBKp34_246 [Klebsiella phage vB_KpM_FBKp34]
MIYKVKITRIVGDVSVTYEIETEDKSFAESFIAKDKEESQTESESKSKLEDLVKELKTKDSSDWKPWPFGGIECWLNQPKSETNGFGK